MATLLSKQLDDLLNQFGKAKIYLVNTRVQEFMRQM